MNSFQFANDDVEMNANSYTRMARVFSWQHRLSRDRWLRLLGEHWSSCDNIRHCRVALRQALGTFGPVRMMMNRAEQSRYDRLEDIVTCYRGCDSSNLLGASWTLDKEVANNFPFQQRYRVPNPVVVTAQVRRDRILALNLSRDEEEIVTFSARRISVEPADSLAAERYREERARIDSFVQLLDAQIAKIVPAIGAPVQEGL